MADDFWCAFEDFSVFPAMLWRVEDIIVLDGVTVIFGQPKGGKSLVAQSMMLTAAANLILPEEEQREWCGYSVQGCKGLYIVAEGFYGMLRRQAAWKKAHGLEGKKLPIRYRRRAVNFLERASVVAFAAEFKAHDWGDVGFVVIDTLIKAMPGGTDSEAKDMNVFFTNVRWLHEELGNITLVIIHHALKYDDIVRGSGVLGGDVDGLLLVKRAGADKDKEETAEEKQAAFDRILKEKPGDKALDVSAVFFRDADEFAPFRIAVKLFPVMTAAGTQQVPAVVDRIEKPAAEDASKADNKHADSIRLMLFKEFPAEGAFSADLQAKWTTANDVSEKTYKRGIKLLRKRGQIAGGLKQGVKIRLANSEYNLDTEKAGSGVKGSGPKDLTPLTPPDRGHLTPLDPGLTPDPTLLEVESKKAQPAQQCDEGEVQPPTAEQPQQTVENAADSKRILLEELERLNAKPQDRNRKA
jgi:hypothetical protein